MARVHVIGGGLAGLAAAVRIAAAGEAVTLYEATGRAGGRCRSFHDRTLGAVIDNGNHLLLSGNRSARAYLDAIGAGDRLAGPAEAAFPFVDLASGERWELRLGDGPIPWWIFDPRRRVPGTRARHYLAALRLLSASRETTVAAALGGSGALYRRFWEPLAVAALNTPPEVAAAALLRPVLCETFARGGAHCRPLIARESLAHSFVDPALETLRGQGAVVRFHARLSALEFREGHVSAMKIGEERVALDAGERIVLAVPAHIARTLVPGLAVPAEGEAIVNVHYRLPKAQHAGVRIMGLIGGLAEWLFLRGEIASVTISAADHVAARPARAIAADCWRDVGRALGIDPATPLPRHRVIKEKRATFVATPQSLARRPDVRTAWDNLFLAGDWTATGLPATIESAVRSGHKAAEHVLAPGRGAGPRAARRRPDSSIVNAGAHKP